MGEVDNCFMLWSLFALGQAGLFWHPIRRINLEEAVSFATPYYGGEALVAISRMAKSFGRPVLKIMQGEGGYVSALPPEREALKFAWKSEVNDRAARQAGGWQKIQKALMN